MRRCALAFACALAFWPSSARAEARFTPFTGVAAGQNGERLRVRFDGEEQYEDRWLWNTRLIAGLSLRLPETVGPRARLDSSVGFGVVYHTGHGQLELREAALYELPIAGDLSLPVGVAPAVSVDTASSARSSLALAPSLGLAWRFIEIAYRPSYTLPLGAERRRVFTGTRELSARPGISLVEFSLFFHLRGLDF